MISSARRHLEEPDVLAEDQLGDAGDVAGRRWSHGVEARRLAGQRDARRAAKTSTPPRPMHEQRSATQRWPADRLDQRVRGVDADEHEDEQEQHHHGAGVDDHLDDAEEHGVLRDVEDAEAIMTTRRRARRAPPSGEQQAERGEHHDRPEDPEDDRLAGRGHRAGSDPRVGAAHRLPAGRRVGVLGRRARRVPGSLSRIEASSSPAAPGRRRCLDATPPARRVAPVTLPW